jgi:Protein phosphatase 2C
VSFYIFIIKLKFLGKIVARKNKSIDKVDSPIINSTNESIINKAINPPSSDNEQPTNLDSEVVLIESNDELLIRPTGNWYAVAEAVVGLTHRRAEPPLPCQDAFSISTKPRVSLLVADGAGSAAVSEIGANAVVNSCQRLLDTFDDQVSELLDSENELDIIESMHNKG